MIKPHTSDIRVTFDIRISTSDIRTSDTQVPTNDMRMT